MKFHSPSFAIGIVASIAYFGARKRLRPVVVEMASFGVHVGRLLRALAERQREDLEDLWAEVELRVAARAHGGEREPSPIEPRPSSPGPAAAEGRVAR